MTLCGHVRSAIVVLVARAAITSPDAAARTCSPGSAAKSTPSLRAPAPLRLKPETTEPETGRSSLPAAGSEAGGGVAGSAEGSAGNASTDASSVTSSVWYWLMFGEGRGVGATLSGGSGRALLGGGAATPALPGAFGSGGTLRATRVPPPGMVST